MRYLIIILLITSSIHGQSIKYHISHEIMAINPNLPILVNEVLTDAGYQPVLVDHMPSIRSIYLMSKGEIDMEFRVPAFTKRQNFAIPIEVPVTVISFRVFIRKDLNVESLKDVDNLTFCVVKGAPVNQQVFQMLNSKKMVELKSIEQAIRFVSSGRGDFFIQERETGLRQLKEEGVEENIRMIDEVLIELPIYPYILSTLIDDKPSLEDGFKDKFYSTR